MYKHSGISAPAVWLSNSSQVTVKVSSWANKYDP